VVHPLSRDALARVRAGAHAALTLERDGLPVLDAAFATPWGSIDLIAAWRGTIVFCQVGLDGPPDLPELPTLRRIAGAWLDAHPQAVSVIRFDTITLGLDASGGLRWLVHRKDAGHDDATRPAGATAVDQWR
jgi:Holliday junction resolvase-like predicted endonuclease